MKKMGLLFILISTIIISYAQNWHSGNGISDKNVRAIIEYNLDTLLAGVDNGGVFISYDNGKHWSQFALPGETIYSLIKVGRSVIAGSNGNDIYKATSINSSWNQISINKLVINSFKMHNDSIFACTYGKTGPGAVYTSVDTGNTWHQYSTTPPYAYLGIDFSESGRTYVATPSGAYYSDKKLPWVKTTGIGSTTRTVNYLGNDSILYGSDIGIYLSTDNGVSVKQLNNVSGNLTFKIEDTLYVASYSGISYSNKISGNWKSLSLGKTVNTLTKIKHQLFAGTTTGLYMLSNYSIDSINNLSNSNIININIFPNPTSGKFFVSGFVDGSINLELFNLTGEILYQSNDPYNDISDLKKGVYLVRIENGKKNCLKKIVKQ